MMRAIMSDLDRRDKKKAESSILFKKSCVVTLSLFIVIFFLSKNYTKTEKIPVLTFIDVFTDVPLTDTRGSMPRPPDLPKIPIPVEDDYVPPDETIPDTDFKIEDSISLFDGNSPNGLGAGAAAPRPILEVVPFYPEKLRKKGIEGIVIVDILVNTEGEVDSVKIISNTSKSRELEKYAKSAAYKTKYIPAKLGGDIVPFWLRRSYTFSRKRR
ncbi:hypothetical protein DRQ07_02055 [candidate division KSB1 bacterium]|nr:MAG: hypothetical protein DRQ07_02055 [candidate division KSB1 bacterium]